MVNISNQVVPRKRVLRFNDMRTNIGIPGPLMHVAGVRQWKTLQARGRHVSGATAEIYLDFNKVVLKFQIQTCKNRDFPPPYPRLFTSLPSRMPVWVEKREMSGDETRQDFVAGHEVKIL